MLSTRADPGFASSVVPDFAALYEAHFDHLALTLRRVGVREAQLDDALQETFMVVHRRLHEFEGRSALKTWLTGIALLVASNFVRATQRLNAATATDVDPDTTFGNADPQRAAEHSEAVRRLYALLNQIDLEHRVVFVLAELQQMTAPEISEAISVKLNTVYSRLRVARERFQAALDAEGVCHE